MASNTVTATTLAGRSTNKGHLRLVDAAEAQRIADHRRLQWQAMQAGHATPVRLTKRGRRVLALLILVPLATMLWLFGGHGAAAVGTAPTTKTVVVQAGQSLWSIAQTAVPTADPRETIYKIKQLNHFAGSDILPGQAVIVPTGN
ncbi:MAG: LysM peptidoglycan-binding domain-containing protein [Actinobacteria bacterium]|nr:LysM peptidoglycan-binding domain-containing protein [Actinomycetota bacterium]